MARGKMMLYPVSSISKTSGIQTHRLLLITLIGSNNTGTKTLFYLLFIKATV